jgi:NAD+ diphosphatase
MTAERDDNPFSGACLERRSESRSEPGWLRQSMAEPGTRFLLSCGTSHLVRRDPDTGINPGAHIAFLDGRDPLVLAATASQMILLGWYRGERCVLIDAAQEPTPLPAGTQFAELRPLLGELPADQGAVLACARALLVWRARHRHCGTCGAATAASSAGHNLRCTAAACGAEYFPRIDPAVIVLVTDGEHALLGRQAGWPPGRHSTLAGFVEPGESLEDTVRREVYEETGVRVTGVTYFASQPWPFPASLMLGFHAVGQPGPIKLDGELEAARWFSRAELAAADASLLPPQHTIARRLIDAWSARAAAAPRAAPRRQGTLRTRRTPSY